MQHGHLGAAKDALERLSWAGFPTYLDDFGTGFAALSSLSSLPLRGVKVDRSLVSTLPDKGSEAVLRALVGLAHDLDLTVTAEGVEAPTQFAPWPNLAAIWPRDSASPNPIPRPTQQLG